MARPSSPSSPTSPLPSTSPPPWHPILKKSYSRNFLYSDEAVYLSMSNIKRSGDVSMHCLQFQGFLEEDPRFIEFPLAMNDNILMGDIKSDPNARLSWTMPKTKEYFKFSGKFYIASAPIQVTRFPPPKIPSSDLAAADFWENERKRRWKALSDQERAVFTWPSRGEVPKADRIAFSCQSLGNLAEKQESGRSIFGSLTSQKPNDSLQVVHDIAMDNFCLLVYRISEVEYFDYSSFPPRRTIYTYSLKDNQWLVQDANP
ncbi:hypothetical protein VTP01DRAFT_1854 [Rhizomucor pusillus]|uniref:uncharacterized protein n=1 Tax=Rhizomucor pusillus TaxID=4840 RepID=UPI003741FD4D